MGGDARYVEVIHLLAAKGMKVFLIGYDQLTFENPTIIQTTIEDIDFGAMDAISLPVAGTNETGKVEAIYTDKDVYLTEEMVNKTSGHCVIYTGTANAYLKHVTKSANRTLITLFERDDLAIYNSIPTAEGTLLLAIEHTDLTVHGSNVMVLGFGRVGKTVARLFASVGASVRVAVRKPADTARIKEMGLTPIRLENLESDIAGMDIILNTIPHPIIDSEAISAMKKSTLIIDITSAPGGTDFNFAHEQGIKAFHALGLPGKTAPKSAGRFIGGVLLDLLKKNGALSE